MTDTWSLSPALRRRLWRPRSTAPWVVGLALAATLPFVAAWMASEPMAFRRLPSLPFLIATVAATLIGRLSASLVATVVSGVLISTSELSPQRIDVSHPEDLIGIAAFVGISFVIAYMLALKDAANEEASFARSEIESVARALAAERNTMRQVLQQMPNAVMVTDGSGSLTMQNRRARDLLGHEHAVGRPILDDPDAPWSARHLDGRPYDVSGYPLTRSLRSAEVVIGERMAIDRADGSTVMIDVDSAPIRSVDDDSIVGAVVVFQDVTERVETQAQLAATTTRLRQIQAVTDAALTEMRFDDLADRLLHTVRRMLGTDSATLLLVDRSGELLFEHSTVGVETDPSTPVPVGRGIAGTIASERSPLVIEDLSGHQSVRHWLTDTMRSLMGAPLTFRGRVTGVIHVATREQRRFTPEEVSLLELVANRIASALERASLYESRSAMSQALQRSLVPESLPRIEGVELSALYLPFSPDEAIGGDFYDVFPHGEDTWGVVVGDVSGKGPVAAAVMGLAAHTVRALARYETRPSAVLTALNETLLGAERVPAERFCTVCHMRLRPLSDRVQVTVCLAGHPPPFVARAGGTVETIGEPGTLLGSFPQPVLHDVQVDLHSGDALVAYTDGLVERRSEGLERGEGALAAVLCRCVGLSSDEIVARITEELIEPAQLDDDVALVVVRKP